MIEELAVVVKIENHQVWVTRGSSSACGGCQQKAACTTHALGSVLSKKSVPVDCDLALQMGDQVVIAVDENVLLHVSLLLYLLPLIALFTGAGLADWLIEAGAGNADLWIAGSGLLGFLLSLWLINTVQSQLVLSVSRPVVVKKL